ncbi:MAG: DUF3017 domain-containing protein [Corynebacterium sp.]|nr:DUF3017 domain-containing protein [Corynebacterium sp.]
MTPNKAQNTAKNAVDPLFNPHDVNLPASFLPRRVQQAAMGGFFLALIMVIVFIGLERWRRSTFTLALAMGWLALVRATCDSRILGIFAVRSRFFDCFFNLVLAAGLMFLSVSVDSLGS